MTAWPTQEKRRREVWDGTETTREETNSHTHTYTQTHTHAHTHTHTHTHIHTHTHTYMKNINNRQHVRTNANDIMAIICNKYGISFGSRAIAGHTKYATAMPRASALQATVVAMVRSLSSNHVEATNGGGLMKKADPSDAMICPVMIMLLADCAFVSPSFCRFRQRTTQPMAWHHAPAGVQSSRGTLSENI
jgi:hypothetical protein